MGDARFDKPYEALKEALRPSDVLRLMSSEDVIAALASASRHNDPLLANVLATEAQNRVAREAKAMEELTHGVYVVDTRGVVAYVNPAAARILRRAATEIIGRPAREVIDLGDPTLPANPGHGPVEVALATGSTIESEQGVLALGPGGEHLLVAYSAVPIQRESIITGLVVGFRDITAQRHAEEALARSETRHRLLLDVLPDAILLIDQHGLVLYANPAASELFGCDAEELVGTDLGIPALDTIGVVVDVTTAGGSWLLARLRTVASSWEKRDAYVSIYSRIGLTGASAQGTRDPARREA